MCGRFALHLSQQEIQDNVNIGEWINRDNFAPRYNIAPRTQAPVIRRRDPGPSESNELVLQTMRWGLVPHWSKYEDKTLSTTNARSENLVEGGGMWKSIKGRKRCAVVCEGYYEWLTKGKDKLPHFTKHKDGRLMLLAGLYDSVVLEGESERLWTFTIVTTAASKDFAWLHDRQPVILSTEETLNKWLDTTSLQWSSDLAKLVEPYHDSTSPLECYQVPKEVGKVGTESPSFIQPISQRKDGIQAMFSKQANKGEKRKRSSSPSRAKEKTKEASKTDDDEIVILDGPSTPKKIKKKSVSPMKQSAERPSKEKITSFFTKTSK